MTLGADEVDLLRRSFQAATRDMPDLVDLFYRRLFEIAPETRLLFRGDMALQGEKLKSTLGMMIAQIQDIAMLHPMLADLARRHVRYGVVPRHYALVGEALLLAVRRTLGDGFDDRIEGVWRAAYQGIAEAMIAAAHDGQASRVA